MKVDNRTRLVEEVKAIGQEIIDRAEDIVGEGDLISNLTLMVSFSGGPEVQVPTLEITREQYSKNIQKLYAGDMFDDEKAKSKIVRNRVYPWERELLGRP